MRKLKMWFAAAALAAAAVVPALAPAPAPACTGDVCDGFCDWYNANSNKLPPKYFPRDCPLR
jgi:hypothetical protein